MGDKFILTSVVDPAAGVEFIEVPADGVYEARLDRYVSFAIWVNSLVTFSS